MLGLAHKLDPHTLGHGSNFQGPAFIAIRSWIVRKYIHENTSGDPDACLWVGLAKVHLLSPPSLQQEPRDEYCSAASV
jgi:hypothetical protein